MTHLATVDVLIIDAFALEPMTREEQGGVCFVCQKAPSTGRLVIDHFHRKGWKKLPPAERARDVRGLLCWFCNHAYVGRAITVGEEPPRDPLPGPVRGPG